MTGATPGIDQAAVNVLLSIHVSTQFVLRPAVPPMQLVFTIYSLPAAPADCLVPAPHPPPPPPPLNVQFFTQPAQGHGHDRRGEQALPAPGVRAAAAVRHGRPARHVLPDAQRPGPHRRGQQAVQLRGKAYTKHALAVESEKLAPLSKSRSLDSRRAVLCCFSPPLWKIGR